MNREKALRIAVLALGLLTAGVAGLCIYQYAAAAAAARATAAQQDALATARQYAAELQRMQADGRLLTDKIRRRAAPWTWSEQLPVMVTQISSLIEGSGAKIDTLQPAPLVERQGLTRFPLRLTLRTDVGRLTSMLRQTRQAMPLLAVDHFAVRAGEKPGDPLTVEMTLSSYVIIEGQSTGGRP